MLHSVVAYFTLTKMGQVLGTATTRHLGLKMDQEPTFASDKGFSYKRQTRRAVKATTDELNSAKIPTELQDYCADELLAYQVCRYEHMPFLIECDCERHAYLSCEQQDYVIRMKEFERERRLIERENRIKDLKSGPETKKIPEPEKISEPETNCQPEK